MERICRMSVQRRILGGCKRWQTKERTDDSSHGHSVDFGGGILTVPLSRGNGKSTFSNVSRDLLYLDYCLLWDPLADPPYDPEDCEPGVIPGSSDIDRGELVYCPDGNALSLFPSTYIYVTATVVDPEATYWDPVQGEFIEGPLESKIFYQFAGFKPDLNNNGVDDLIDIRTETSVDENDNGIPDEVEEKDEPSELEELINTLQARARALLNWIYLLLALIIGLISFSVFTLRKIG